MSVIQMVSAKDVPTSFYEPRVFSDELTGGNVTSVVSDILTQVRQNGDAALFQLSA